jgi:aminoglycoside phosphotransferase (APT) family kinase protein
MPMNHDPYASIVTRLYPDARLKAMDRLTGGVSADVHRLDLSLRDGSTISLVLRAHGASHSGHAAELEYKLLQALYRGGVPVPEPLLVDVRGSVLADPFLVMGFIEGTSDVPSGKENQAIDLMADALANIHAMPTISLPTLPLRNDPLPDVFDYLPEGSEWQDLRTHLAAQVDTAYQDSPKLLHGDFWPENLLWHHGAIAGILDWEDAALGDPLSDVACARVELRYRFGEASMEQFTKAYARHQRVDRTRLALWQVYIAAAAQKFMSGWGLAPAREAHMRTEALASVREAGALLMGRATG